VVLLSYDISPFFLYIISFLYTLALSGITWLGAITPLGGVAFLLGWLALAVGVWR